MVKNNKSGISRRTFLKATGAAAFPLAARFLPRFNVPAYAQDVVKLQMWTWYQEQVDEFPKLDKEFNDSHTNIQIENRIYASDTEYLPVLTAAIAGGVAPDIFGPHVHAIEYGLAGETVDLNPLLGEDFMSQFFPSTRRQFTADGKQYAIGWMAQTFGFFYNPPLFEKAGVEVPETWDDLIAISADLKKSGTIPWAFNESDKWLGCDFFLPLITQVTDDTNLVYDLDEHTKEGVSWNSDPVIEAIDLVDRLVKAEVFEEGVVGTNWEQSTAMFYSGLAAMMFAGSWVPQGIVQNASPDFAKTYRVFKTPAWAAGKPHWCGNQAGAALCVNAKGHVEQSIEYLQWLYEPDRYAQTMNNSLSMPSTAAGADMVEDPIMKEMTSWLSEGAPHILFGKGSWDAVSNAMQGVFAQTLTPAEAAKQIEDDVVAARSR
jgi:ABC-type glycerol-3-phosphate transport system substrate-binding protein